MLEDAAAVEPALIAVENISGPIFFVSAKRDEYWPSSEMADAMMQRLKAKQSPWAHQHLAIDGDHAAPLDHFAEIEAFLDQQSCQETKKGV